MHHPFVSAGTVVAETRDDARGGVLTSTRLAVRKPGVAIWIASFLYSFLLVFPCRMNEFYMVYERRLPDAYRVNIGGFS